MTQDTRRTFDATWMPFGMLIGFILGVGASLAVSDNLFVGATIGFVAGTILGIVLGFRTPKGSEADEDAEDDRRRATQDDPPPQHPDDH